MSTVFDLVTDPHGLITDASREAAAVLKIEERWLLHKPLASFVAENDRHSFRLFLNALAIREGPVSRHFALQPRAGAAIEAKAVAHARDGRVYWDVVAEAPAAPAPVGPSRLAGVDRETMLMRLLARLPQGVLVVDRDLSVVFVNPAARRILGSTVQVDHPLGDLWPDYSLRALAGTLFTSHPEVGPQVISVDGHTYSIEGLLATGAPTATLLIEDVTARENARRAERNFVQNAAHELRTPLAAIASVVETLDAGAKHDPAALDSFLAHLRTHSARLTRLATSLLVLARIQTGLERVQLDLVELEPLLSEVADELSPAQGVSLEVRVPGNLAVLADRDLLLHVLENVGANAVKHTREGSIVFEARDVGHNAEIEIRDTGAGMNSEQSRHAFDRFFRAHEPDGDTGFGLGLAIAQEAVRALGGTIRLDSAASKGTRVRISLPSAKVVA